MKHLYLSLIFIIFLLPFIQAQEDLLSQRVSITLEDQYILEAFELIEQQSDVKFAYSRDFIPEKRISEVFIQQEVREVLEYIFRGTQLAFLVQGDQVVIYLDRKKKIGRLLTKIKKNTLHGYIRDKTTGEELIGASIFINPVGEGTSTNTYGFYSLTLIPDQYRIEISYVGYEMLDTTLQLTSDQRLDFSLNESSVQLQQVIVTAEEKTGLFSKGGIGVSEMDLNNLNQIPSLFGEQDLIQGLQLLPGVSAAGGTGGDISVRGGGSDQNLILLDGAPIYNASHMLGAFSVFNPDALKKVRLYKGRIPTEYRGRLSSVVDIQMQEGNMNKLSVDGGIGLLSSRLKAEGPIVKQRSSFMLAGRRSYWDLIVKALAGDITSTAGISYYDLNAKVNYRINDRDRIFLSGYFGRDRFRFNANNGIDWGNRTGTFRWNHLVSDRLFMHTSLIFSDYRYTSIANISELELPLEEEEEMVIENLNSIQTRIRDFNFKVNFQLFPDLDHSLKFGAISTFHRFIPAQLLEDGEQRQPNINRDAFENSLFVNHNWQINDRLNLDYGLHFSHLATLGTDNYEYTFDGEGNLLDSIYYKKGEVLKTYFRVEPRISATYFLDKKQQQWVGLSFNRTYQYLQRISSSFANNPSRVWLPSSQLIKPQLADQLSLGYFVEFGKKKYGFSVEGFYKIMKNRINFREGAFVDEASRYVEGLLVFGEENAKGVEFLLQKREGRFKGWISYTFSKNEGKYPQIDNGASFPLQYDRTHDFAIVGIWDVSRRVTLSANWVYFTGSTVSLPNGKYEIDGQIIDFYNQRNSYRMSPHQRLDLGITLYRKRQKRKKEASWNFAFSNLYLHKNPYFIFVSQEDDSLVQEVSLFRFVPSITYNFKI